MTFRVEPVFDQHYSCPSSHDGNEHPTDVDRRTWTCRTCLQSVYIDVADKAGNSFQVERCPAREIREDDVIVSRTNTDLNARRVTASSPSQRKPGKWRLAAEKFGSDDNMRPEQFVSRIPL